MLLLAEAYTVNEEANEAISLYQQILDEQDSGDLHGDAIKDIYRRLAPLYSLVENYMEACTCLKKVIEEETQEILKVGLYTKLAGNFKKANMKDQCIKASTDAFELIKRISGEKDAQTCRCMINLAQVY